MSQEHSGQTSAHVWTLQWLGEAGKIKLSHTRYKQSHKPASYSVLKACKSYSEARKGMVTQQDNRIVTQQDTRLEFSFP